MLAIKGIYKEGKIELLEPLPAVPSAELLIVVVPEGSGEKRKGYEASPTVSGEGVMESGKDWKDASETKESGTSRAVYSAVFRQTVKPDANGVIHIQAPPGFGDRIEVILLPLSDSKSQATHFECTDEDGMTYKVSNWTDEEWQVFSLRSFADSEDDQEVDWEEYFDAENR